MNSEFLAALDQVEKDKGISKEILIEAIENALLFAYKKEHDQRDWERREAEAAPVEYRGFVNRETGDMGVYPTKTVVEEVADPVSEISIDDARRLSKSLSVGDTCEVNVMPRSFGRIAAQTAKQVVVQRIREAEREIICNEYTEKKGDIIQGLIQRVEKGTKNNVMMEIGRVEAMLIPSEQVPTEKYVPGEKMYLYVVDVKDDQKGTQIVISRTHPGLVKRLFEMEVPEIADGTVEIKAISREAGSRSKIAVFSNNKDVDAIGACVGAKGMRVANVLKELRGEKVDIINYSENPVEYITAALAPSKVLRVEVFEEEKSCMVEVPEEQLSLAIGKEGQNARLAAKLTGWKIDIKSV